MTDEYFFLQRPVPVKVTLAELPGMWLMAAMIPKGNMIQCMLRSHFVTIGQNCSILSQLSHFVTIVTLCHMWLMAAMIPKGNMIQCMLRSHFCRILYLVLVT